MFILRRVEDIDTDTNFTEISLQGIRVVEVPETTVSAGSKGDIAFDENYLYVCISSNVWRRVAIGTW